MKTFFFLFFNFSVFAQPFPTPGTGNYFISTLTSNGVYLSQGGTNRWVGTGGTALVDAFSATSPGDMITIGPGVYATGTNQLNPAPNVTIFCWPGVHCWTTNLLSGSPALLKSMFIPSSGMKLYGNGMILSNSLPNLNTAALTDWGTTFGIPPTSTLAATNYYVNNCTFIGTGDTCIDGTTNGISTGVLEDCTFVSSYDVWGVAENGSFLPAASRDITNYVSYVFNRCRFITTNWMRGAVASTCISSVKASVQLNDCYFKINTLLNTNVMNSAPSAVSPNGGQIYLYNCISDLVSTNLITKTTDNEGISYSFYTADANITANGSPGSLTNLVFCNYSRSDGTPLFFNTIGGAYYKQGDNATRNVAVFDSGTTNGNVTIHLLLRSLGARYRVNVYHYCTQAGITGTLSSTLTYNDLSDTALTQKPTTDITLDNIANHSSGSFVFTEGSYNYGTSSHDFIDIACAVAGSAGSPKYRIIVTLEQLGGN